MLKLCKVKIYFWYKNQQKNLPLMMYILDKIQQIPFQNANESHLKCNLYCNQLLQYNTIHSPIINIPKININCNPIPQPYQYKHIIIFLLLLIIEYICCIYNRIIIFIKILRKISQKTDCFLYETNQDKQKSNFNFLIFNVEISLLIFLTTIPSKYEYIPIHRQIGYDELNVKYFTVIQKLYLYISSNISQCLYILCINSFNIYVYYYIYPNLSEGCNFS
eukprot:TRINITY_DN48761_c0_g1_i2.p1 TRINITY_DN48761_c0_g1~~TRINITY_DN48761_c0_g1_i2.p1  ORF type:complete len:220 (-),score=-18.89 TRINITY_DN48761_c0_g1_i2:137-796(-)